MDNAGDGWIPADASAQADPFVRWSRIGNSLEGNKLYMVFDQMCVPTIATDGGLLGWITLGVNTTNLGMQQPPNKQKRSVIDWHLE
jgi:hypothetical protein